MQQEHENEINIYTAEKSSIEATSFISEKPTSWEKDGFSKGQEQNPSRSLPLPILPDFFP